jgi:hypothetical protein
MKQFWSDFILLVLVFGFLNSFTIMNTGANSMVLSSSDETNPIANEPLLFSTLTGLASYDEIISVGLDDADNLYVTGIAKDTGDYDNPWDCFLWKINGTDFSLIYTTVFGGTGWDSVADMFVSPLGRVYITGSTNSPDFPVQNAFCSDYQNGSDCFIICFDTNGEDLLFSTYLGGNGGDKGESIFVDAEGCIYVTGSTESSSFPQINSYSSYSGWSDVFVVKFNSTGNGLLYSSLIGGNEAEVGVTHTVDSQGNAYVAGSTISEDFPTVNAYDNSSGQLSSIGPNEGFVFCLNSTGNGLIFSTFIGGTESEAFYDIDLDSQGDVWVCGYTESNDFPMIDSFQQYHDWTECVIFELNSNGSVLLFSTIFGGQDYDVCFSMDIDERDNVYVAGSSSSSEFPLVREDRSYLSTYWFTASNCFVMKISPEKTILYSTFVGGRSSETGRSIVIDENGAAFVGGTTFSDDFPLRRAISEPANDIMSSYDGFAFILLDISDEDGDNIPNWWEIVNGFDPLNPDTSLMEVLSWYAPIILSVAVVAALTMVILCLGRNRIRSVFKKRAGKNVH